MALTMRPTGLGHGVYKDSIDYSVFSGDWLIGRIFLVVARRCAHQTARHSHGGCGPHGR
jgi:hypothetical protein